MSIQELKEQIAALPIDAQEEVMAFLFHLRHANDSAYQRDIARRVGDVNPSHWLSADEFERALDKKV